jgi:hypothetical protein
MDGDGAVHIADGQKREGYGENHDDQITARHFWLKRGFRIKRSVVHHGSLRVFNLTSSNKGVLLEKRCGKKAASIKKPSEFSALLAIKWVGWEDLRFGDLAWL